VPTLLLADEIAAMAALGLWGRQVGTPRWLLVGVLPLAVMTAGGSAAHPRRGSSAAVAEQP
jgi:hypothetical protein